jgi:hypothetical protein
VSVQFGVSGTNPGGLAYGNLLAQLQGGSFGGFPQAVNSSIGNGGGGGLEIGAVGTVHLLGTGSILANGGTSGPFFPSVGGGSGGGIFLHGNSILLDSAGLISADGGAGGPSQSAGGPGGFQGATGGGGGGGRILLETGYGGLSRNSTIDVSGGSGGIGTPFGTAGPGADGQLIITTLPNVPEPASIVMLTLGLVAIAELARRQLAA